MKRKKLKLRNWVKIVLALTVIALLFCLLNIHTEKAIKQCVNAGNSYNFCVEGLAK